MNVLDENFPESQRQLLRDWRIQTRQIGFEMGRQGMKDADIIRLLHQLSKPVFFTLDSDFYTPRLCHTRYALVQLAVNQYKVAEFVRRYLKHPMLNTWAQRSGTVARVHQKNILIWRLHGTEQQELKWPA